MMDFDLGDVSDAAIWGADLCNVLASSCLVFYFGIVDGDLP